MACSDVQTIQAGNGTKTQFSFDFPYIFKSEIHVYFWNAVTKEYDEKLTTDATYPWRITDANPTIVEFTSTAPPSPTTPVDPGEPTVDNVKIRRITKVDDIRALFNPGSAIRSDDLNKNFEQLRYALQEANCQDVPEEIYEFLENYHWNKYDSTVYSTETWDSDDDQVATTQATDARIDAKIDTALTTDIAGSDGVSITDDGDGTITVGLTDDSVDFDKIKDADQIKLADQTADYDNTGSDNKVFTSVAAIRRFENFVQDSTPSTTAGIGKGRVWVDIADDKTLSVWDGSAWQAITSGGTFTNQPKVVYVDAEAGSDSNDGHRISRPKATIKAAINQINDDSTYGDGSVVVVAPGVYQEAAPIQIQKKNVSIIGTALRSCIVHPTVATQGDHADGNHALFELNSGSFIQNLTLTGMKAGTYDSGDPNTLDSDLPKRQGWNFAFFADATITKSPYIQNCTNFSDSEIDNSDINVNNPAGGAAGDTDSAPTGGGMLVNGDAVHDDSPLRSMVADSYTHVGLNGPGILVTNNGYTQATSSYAFFNRYHIKCLNGGQANLAASTTDFGDEALVADGKSTTAIFTSNVDGAAADGDTTFNINEPTAGTGWFGDAQRPASNMLVTVNSVTYPVLSATANTDSEGGAGWTVTISRPNPNKRSENLGLNGAIDDDAAVSFFLRSMIASSGHTMEYVGSGTNYSALPENGGVPNAAKQIVESNDGKIWTAITDHNGRFAIGDFFTVDQRTGSIEFSGGSVAFDVVTDETPELGGELDALTNKIVNLGTPTAAADAATKGYVDDNATGISNVVEDTTPQLGGELDCQTNKVINLGTPTATTDATTKTYVDTADATKLSLSGGTMTGLLTLSGAPTANLHAATKAYADTMLPLAGGTLTGALTLSGDPTADLHAATKAYVDANAGGGGGTFTATASGALTDGATVVVNSDGTVSVVSGTVTSTGLGTEDVFETGSTEDIVAVYCPDDNKVVVAYKDAGDSNKGKAVLGTISSGNITFGTPVEFDTGASGISMTYDELANRVVLHYKDSANSNYLTLVVGDPSGSNITFGSPNTYYSAGGGGNKTGIIYDPNAQRCFGCWANGTGETRGIAIKTSSTSVSISGTTQVVANTGLWFALAFDTSVNKIVIAYQDDDDSDKGHIVICTLTATEDNGSMAFGGETEFEAGITTYIAAAYDANASKTVIAYVDASDSNKGKALAVSVNSSSVVTKDTIGEFEAGSTAHVSAAYDPDNQNVIIFYRDGGNSNRLQAIEATVNGSNLDFGTAIQLTTDAGDQTSLCYSTVDDVFVAAFRDGGNSDQGTGATLTIGSTSTNLTAENYIGISDGAYADAATATIQIVGSVDDAQSGLTPGQAYYVQLDGTLATTPATTSVFAGTAVAATKLIVKG